MAECNFCAHEGMTKEKWQEEDMRQIRTDLAMESHQAAGSVPGVWVKQWETEGVTITEVSIEDEAAARQLDKPVGKYITLECEGVKRRDPDARVAMSNLLSEELARLLPQGEQPVMVIGLGNRQVTPDALGPMTVDRTLVTRHLFRELPQYVDSRMSSVCAVAPGVLGVTGLETIETLKGLVEQIQPRAVIAIDSLSARASGRVASTVQLSDSGIQPGSGVGNLRKAITRETLGTTVIAVGVPMVVYAATIVRDALEQLAGDQAESSEQALDALTQQLFDGSMGEMIVTPREIDALVADAAQIVATGINRALHSELSEAEIHQMMN